MTPQDILRAVKKLTADYARLSETIDRQAQEINALTALVQELKDGKKRTYRRAASGADRGSGV